ncbi:MAG: DUF5721 family protein [Lachnospiraceae bacterium]|jgi:hypothetical protein|nr:hypothetical protein [Lachnospiraceae bacterium]MCI5880481.1 DUF5721 family protein [Clostridium sp.]MDD6179212.1 DUF5721 family protein [Clostridium sp.]MDY4820047.1 DUF5721 family protein [Lachnospiraceae bacterium]MEE0398264.1 DUF5721 family protein [Lachnospiraceae bacterium]
MIALQITGLKNFMNAMLTGNVFDTFLLEEASVTTAVTYHIDGHAQKDFSPCEYEFIPWADIKGICFQLIKGTRVPLHFQFVFHLMPKHVESILKAADAAVDPSLIRAFVLTLRYNGEIATLYTGTAYTTFVADKEPEKLWDAACEKYLLKKEIACERL